MKEAITETRPLVFDALLNIPAGLLYRRSLRPYGFPPFSCYRFASGLTSILKLFNRLTLDSIPKYRVYR